MNGIEAAFQLALPRTSADSLYTARNQFVPTGSFSGWHKPGPVQGRGASYAGRRSTQVDRLLTFDVSLSGTPLQSKAQTK
jgi:hypothetical protein